MSEIVTVQSCPVHYLLHHSHRAFSPDLSNKNVPTQAGKHLNIKWILKSNHSALETINQTECCQPSSYKESSFPPLWRDFWACYRLFTLNRSPNLSWLSKDCKVMRAALCSKGQWEMLEKTDFVNLGLVFVKDLVRRRVIRWRVPPLVVQSGCKRAATLDWKPVNVCGMTVVKNAQMLTRCWLFSWVLKLY